MYDIMISTDLFEFIFHLLNSENLKVNIITLPNERAGKISSGTRYGSITIFIKNVNFFLIPNIILTFVLNC